MTKIYESDVEEMIIESLLSVGYTYLSPEEQETERPSLEEVVLPERLRSAIAQLNPNIPHDAQEYALKQILLLPTQNLVENNEIFHIYLTEGVPVEYQKEGNTVGGRVQIVDFENPANNNLLVSNQFTIHYNNTIKRPDVVLLINGLPLVVIELKNPTDENATTKKAFTQLQNYKNAVPNLF